ncbi:hypothetical protein [Baaleninema sp.]|uniref:hypothetical protein n=1 Tax=Baaleninema sp. TaxID=3101197 RepID=UPI003D0678A0
MDDEQLRKLAIAAQDNPPDSKARRIILTQLVEGIIKSGRIAYPKAPGMSPGRYRDYRAEALQNLFVFVCQNIDRYDRNRGSVMSWVNVLLERRFFREVARVKTDPIEDNVPKSNTDDLMSVTDPEEIAQESVPLLSDCVRRCLEEDLDGQFSQKSIRRYPHATFQNIALRRLDGYQWQEISEELGVKVSTLGDFYQRCLKTFGEQIKACVQNLEY